MAALPPRKANSSPVKISKQHLSPLQMLLQMGFSKHRAEKALAATGHRGIQLASDWLLAHVNDATIDLDCPREYCLYLCPTGPLNEQVEYFWNESLQKCGWNAAHNLVPHITLCSFFKCSDDKCESLVSRLRDTVSEYLLNNKFPPSLTLDKYVSPNYMGLFLNNAQAEDLQSFVQKYLKESSYVDTLRVSGEVSKKELHLTLAYSFSSSHFGTLEALAASVDAASPAGWEVRLYSRDPRIVGYEVHRVLYSHVPREVDELELLIGDFVYVNKENVGSSPDGWVDGTSWLTGCQGFLPVNYIEKTAESDAWTLHCAIPIIGGSPGSDTAEETELLPRRPRISLSLLNLLENSEGSRRSADFFSDSSIEKLHSRQTSLDLNPKSSPESCQNRAFDPSISTDGETQGTRKTRAFDPHISGDGDPQGTRKTRASDPHISIEGDPHGIRKTVEAVKNVEVEALYSKVDLSAKRKNTVPVKGPRRLLVVRHAERVDFTFGDWIRFCFDESGRYLQRDLNMPVTLPRRDGAPRSFYKDCPLTNVGLLQARLLGQGMKSAGFAVHHVFSSPSLRCIQTATQILDALDLRESLPICVEPGLFEWLAWHVESMPRFMTLSEFETAGFNVSYDYEPHIGVSELLEAEKETCEQFYARSSFVTDAILKQTQGVGGTVLLVAHAASVDSCCRQLVGEKPRSPHDLSTLLKKLFHHS